MPYKQKYKAIARMNSPYAKLGHSDSVAMQIKEPKTGATQDLNEVVVKGDASKVGAYGRQLDKAFEHIQNTLDTGGFGHGTGAQEAGLGYVNDYRKELERLKERRKKEGDISTLRYMRRRSRNTVGGSGVIPDFLNQPG